MVDGKPLAVLIVGPFALERPSSAELLERFRWLTGRLGQLADPEFAWYLREALSVVVLNQGRAEKFGKLVDCLASLMTGSARADGIANQAHALRADLERARFVERVWEAVGTMIDERSPRMMYTRALAYELERLGLSDAADHVLVGLLVGEPGADPVDEAVRRNGFQREVVELAHKAGDALAGRVGEHGVVMVCAGSGAARKKRQKALDLTQAAAELARKRFQLSLYFGVADARPAEPLSQSHRAALAAETALVEQKHVVFAKTQPNLVRRDFHRLREELVRAEESPALLAARFERYIEAVAIHCGHRIEPALAHLEVGFERVAHGLVQAGVLQPKNFHSLYDALERGSEGVRTIEELFAVYRRAIGDMAEAARQPISARRDHNLRRAIAYIREHYAERLRIDRVARIAGFNRSYFSQLFIEKEGMSFEDYVCGLRLERARQLLADTDLKVTRISELAGFASVHYFCRVFRRSLVVTPGAFRKTPERAIRSRNQSSKTNQPKYKASVRALR